MHSHAKGSAFITYCKVFFVRKEKDMFWKNGALDELEKVLAYSKENIWLPTGV